MANQNKYHKGIGYSDHLPIKATFSTFPYLTPKVALQKNNIASLYSIDSLKKTPYC